VALATHSIERGTRVLPPFNYGAAEYRFPAWAFGRYDQKFVKIQRKGEIVFK